MILATCMLINLKHEYSVFSIYRYTPTKRTRIVFKKDNQRCGAILQHEMKKIAVLIFAPPVAIYILQYV